ncbi:helix-turn-helix domain-containing protein [Bacillus toyonensis]|uniref:Transcriptional regulator n=1 Tax=Bacillus toyonensis TaxID=155322 RepID=A0A2A8HGZ7_9BACI|nr:helix-turn-helix transcriptional regulator [Bacillus toyonensis]PEQ08295.1 transcriptional regulator [Bacillus toyonensis]
MLNAKRLVALIEKKGITQQQLADAIGVSHVSIYYYSIGKKSPGTRTLQKIANYFNVTTDYLLGRSDRATLNEMLDRKFKLLKDQLDQLPPEQQKLILNQMQTMMDGLKQINSPES